MMQDHQYDGAVAPEDFDFEAIYQGKSPLEGVEFGINSPPWDLGEPQPAVIALERGGQLRSDILDAGCGLGEHAIFLAGLGYRVTGFDAAPTAIAHARQRAATRGVDVTFVLADATELSGLPPRYATVLDSGLYHCLNDRQRSDYAAALHGVTLPGAQLHVFCFADAKRTGLRMPNQVSHDDLHAHLGTHWDIVSIEPADYVTTFTREFLYQRAPDDLGPIGVDLDAIWTDQRGRVCVPVWQLHARRR